MVGEPRRYAVPLGGAFGHRRSQVTHGRDLYASKVPQTVEMLPGDLPRADQCRPHVLHRLLLPPADVAVAQVRTVVVRATKDLITKHRARMPGRGSARTAWTQRRPCSRRSVR